jgi:hypothetical protein
MISVTLSQSEIYAASCEGCRRHCINVSKASKNLHGCDDSTSWQNDIEGCLGEKAFAKWANIYWAEGSQAKAGDVGGFEIRATHWNTGRLRISERDSNDKPYVLVTGPSYGLVLRGWVWGREGKLKEYWDDPQPGRFNYFVPQGKIRPMPTDPEELKRVLS